MDELKYTIEAILFAAGEPVPAARMAQTLERDESEIHAAAQALSDELAFARRGIRVLRLDESYQMCSSSEMAEAVTRTLETRKPPKLSASQLETLTIIAYYQPATRAYVEQLRGVDSSYTVNALLTKKLIEECGRLNVPGRPILYKTTPDFLRTFGLQSLDELPEIKKINFADPVQLPEQQSVEELPTEAPEGQMEMQL
ncbi:MAG: SMC-Scp complex subunit ScpB [Ruminococcaceae bacterium]|nr:SMC-Scp complex subunit ScpB [Oscillospiraceae bacterium]